MIGQILEIYPDLNTKNQNTSVGLFVPSLAGGGAERVTVNLAQGFIKRGLKVDLVLQNAVGSFIEKAPTEARIIDLKSPNFVSKLFALVRYLRRERPTAIISVLDNVNAAGWAKRIAGVPTRVLAGVHNTLSIELPNEPGFIGKIKPYLLRSCYLQADAIVAVSKGVAEDLASLSGLPLQDMRIIYNPVVTPDVFTKAKQPVFHPWFAPGEPPIILGVGRLVSQKDFSTLIRAFALVRQQISARLMILGEGEKRPEIEALVKELSLENEVALPGFAENPYAYMAKANVFVLSSAWEGFGNVVAEALATGTPVVSTDCKSGPREILDYGKYGALVPVGDFSALADAILATLHNPLNPELLQQRSLEFSIDTVVDRYLEVLQEVLKIE